MASHKISIKSRETSILNKKLNSSKILLFIFITILALFLYLISSLIFVKTKAKHQVINNPKILVKNIPTTKPTGKTTIKEQVIWMLYKDGYNNTKFWMEIPYPGPYCDACYDYTGGLENSQSLSVIGGEFGNNTDNWEIRSTIINQKGGEDWDISEIPIETIYRDLTSTQIGKSTSYSNSNNQKIVVTHQLDKQIENTKIFTAKIESNHEPTSQIMLFKHLDNTVVISFIDNGNPIYKDVFKHMIDTFSFKPLSSTKYIDLCKKYSAYSDNICDDN